MMHGGFGGGSWMRGGGSYGRGMAGRLGLDREDEDGQIYDHAVVLRLARYLLPHWPKLLLTLAAVAVYTGTIVALPWTVMLIIDDYVRVGDLSGLNVIVPIFLGLALLQYGSQYVHLRTMAFVGQKVLYTLRVGLFQHLQRLSMSFYNKNEVGRVMSRVQNDVQQLQEFLSIVIITIADVLSLGGIIVAMVLMNAQLAGITLLIIPLLFVMMTVWQRFARRAFMRARQAISAVNAGLQENISGVRVVQSMNREGANIRSFDAANSENLGANLEAGRLQAVLFPSVEFLSALGLALVIFFGGSLVLDSAIEVGILVAFALYIQRFFEPVLNLTMQYGSLQRAMASGTRIFELMDVEPDVVDRPGSKDVETVSGDVQFEGVGFHYVEGEPVLQDVDLHVQSGQTVALVGPTGAGKTTIVSLLMRFYDVTDGSIMLDGTDIRDISLDSLSKQMSIVPQEPYLFSGTIRDNIRYNRTGASNESIVSGRHGGGRARLHHEDGERLRHPPAGEGREPQHRAAAAHQLRPRPRRQPACATPRRGDRQHRHIHRDADPEGARRAAQGPYRHRHRPPPLDHQERRPHRRARPRARRGGGQTRRPSRARRTVTPGCTPTPPRAPSMSQSPRQPYRRTAPPTHPASPARGR